MDITTLEDLRTIVRRRRKEMGLTQNKAAGLICHSKKWLSNFENGHVDPPVSMILSLINLLGLRLTVVASAVPSVVDESALTEADIEEGGL